MNIYGNKKYNAFAAIDENVTLTHACIVIFRSCDRFPNLNSRQLKIFWFTKQNDIFFLSNLYFYAKTHRLSIFFQNLR